MAGCTCPACNPHGYGVTQPIPDPPSLLMALSKRTPQTQKAKGVKALINGMFPVPTPVQLVQVKKDIAQIDLGTVGGRFARPCPLHPCPGFVESKVVTTKEALEAMLEKVLQVDAFGELLVMPFQKAAWNLCVTPGRMAIGAGHDGATAPTAKNPAMDFPLVQGLPENIKALAVNAEVAEGEVPHVEAIISPEGKLFWVQIRSGPKVPGGVDYIPEPIVVTKVEQPVEDLLEWMYLVAAFQPGTVAYAPGHGLGSHAALHCIGAGVPFITSFKPQVGQALEPVSIPWDLDALVEGIGWGIGADLRTKGTPTNNSYPPSIIYRNAILLILYGLHHSPAFHGSAGFWLGAAAGTMLRVGISCGQGEYPGDGAGNKKCPAAGQGYTSAVLWEPQALKRNLEFVREMIEGFFSEGIARPYRAYGGPVWGRCTYPLLELDRTMRAVIKAQKKHLEGKEVMGVVGNLIIALNKAVDQAHHGAWWLNRFGTQIADFKAASDGEWGGMMELAPYLRGIELSRSKEKWKEHIKRYLKCDRIRKPKMRVTAKAGEGSLTMTWKYRTYPAVTVNAIGLKPGDVIRTDREWEGTCLHVHFYAPSGEKVYTESFEFEKETREGRRLGREERMREVCSTALTETTAT